ncbi:hypothetical protein [Bacillus toyonensis]|uniref:hypothetical protein n=1 Tax=Bacillus toyonensis TaxID=155322 RepID=UPI000BEFC2DB|nr:hypothetical protein [Bacillus toyonensis]PEO58050.1 hypothetical protein CN579_19930 [Bacillus toyonensis]PFY35686.1 hypothetical protein COL55_30815 [Bacillus toyonensis]PFY55033.1 hypothetical protein COL52_26530 [Bacillus toyonensis]PFY82137.1 hypothetical protein COL62_09890 [Bacillus toyonensis]PHA39135.1 hypothetical protein COE68_23860 [Bacillus toyonensis]
MSSKDIINVFNNYANKWSQRENGGISEISLVLPGFEEHALKTSFPIRTIYGDIHEDEKIVSLATTTIENPYDVEQEEYITLSSNVEEWGRWKFTDVATISGNHVIEVDMPQDIVIPPLGTGKKIPIRLLNEEVQQSGLRTWSVKHPFKLNPRTRVTATLQVKQKEIKRSFSVEQNLSGYLGVITEHLVDNSNISLHQIKRILKCHYHPLIRVTDNGVIIISKGDFSALITLEQMIQIKIEHLDCPEMHEEYLIYNPQTDKTIVIIKNPARGPQKRLVSVVSSAPKPLSGQSYRSSGNFAIENESLPYGTYALQWIVESIAPQPANLHFGVAKDVSGGSDPKIWPTLYSGDTTGIQTSRNFYIGGPQNATSEFQVYVYALYS